MSEKWKREMEGGRVCGIERGREEIERDGGEERGKKGEGRRNARGMDHLKGCVRIGGQNLFTNHVRIGSCSN